jgi:hypothetical protein
MGTGAQIMKTYSCYFIDRTLRVLAHEKVPCADDRAAVSVASDMLNQRTCAGIEVWDRERCVAQLLRERGFGSVHISS